MPILTTVHGRGTTAAKPAAAAANEGYIYFDTTLSRLERSNGATWDVIEGVAAGSGSITASGYTQTTARMLGRTTAATGAIEEITVGSGLSLAAGALTATGAAAVVPWAIIPESGAVNLTSRAVGAANRAIYVPAVIPADCTITGCRITVATQSGNICVGLYNSAGSRVATSGSVACAVAGQQAVNFTGNYSATAGRYYLGFACDNNTATFAWDQNSVSGVAGPATALYEAAAFPLPATLTSGGEISPVAIIGRVSGGTP